MQSLEIISVNLWQILISLLNLLILFLIIKHFLFKPVKKMLAAREEEILKGYRNAEAAEKEALKSEKEWKERLETAEDEAEKIRTEAENDAARNRERIISDAKSEADGIVSRAHGAAELEKRKTREDMKKELAGVSALMAEKLLKREISEKDHEDIFEAFLKDLGDDND